MIHLPNIICNIWFLVFLTGGELLSRSKLYNTDNSANCVPINSDLKIAIWNLMSDASACPKAHDKLKYRWA